MASVPLTNWKQSQPLPVAPPLENCVFAIFEMLTWKEEMR
jgi:hypothetical protein